MQNLAQSHRETPRFFALRALLSELSVYVRRFRAERQVVEVTLKTDQSPVTEVDYLVQLLFEQAVRTLFPRDRLLGEETVPDADALQIRSVHAAIFAETARAVSQWPGDTSGSALWIIDPIDGTKGFIDNLVYAVGVVIVMQDQPLISGIAVNGLEHAFNSLASKPIVAMASPHHVEATYADGTDLVLPDRVEPAIFVSKRFCSRAFVDHLKQYPYRLIEIDSMAKYVAVLLGLGTAYIRAPVSTDSMIWDHLPGIFMLTQQGGCCIDFNRAPLHFSIEHATIDLRNGLICCLSAVDASKFVKIM